MRKATSKIHCNADKNDHLSYRPLFYVKHSTCDASIVDKSLFINIHTPKIPIAPIAYLLGNALLRVHKKSYFEFWSQKECEY